MMKILYVDDGAVLLLLLAVVNKARHKLGFLINQRAAMYRLRLIQSAGSILDVLLSLKRNNLDDSNGCKLSKLKTLSQQ